MDVLQALVGTVQHGEVWSLPVHLVGFTGVRRPGLRRLMVTSIELSFRGSLRLMDQFQAWQGSP
jgi:hypothetical protein